MLRRKESREAKDVRGMVAKIETAHNVTAEAVATEKQLELDEQRRGGLGKLVMKTLENSPLHDLMNVTEREEAATR